MAIERFFEFNFDIFANLKNVIPRMHQNDVNTVFFIFNIFECLEPIKLESLSVRLAIQKPSGLTVYQQVKVIDEKIVAEVRRQGYVEWGIHQAELELYRNGKIVHTQRFSYEVLENIMNDQTVESTNDWPVIHEALEGFISRDEADAIINEIIRDMIANNEIEFDFSKYLKDYLTADEIKILLEPFELHVEDESIHHDRDEIVEIINDTVQVIQGPPGTDGINGTNGLNGTDGLSAFEIAVQQGFIGTESQWLESLRGSDGVDGTNGVDGTPGATGERGEDGKPGTDGLSAFEIAVQNGFEGTESEWIESLRGEDGEQGPPGEPPEDMLWTDILGRPSDFTNLAMLSELDPHTFRVVNTPVTQHEAHNTLWVRTGDTVNWWAQLMLTEFRMEPAVGDVFNIQFQGFREGNWTAGTRMLMRYVYTDATSSEALNWGTVSIGLTPTDVNVEVTIAHTPDPARTLSHINVFLQRDNNGNGFINIRQVRITRRMRGQELLWDNALRPVASIPVNTITNDALPTAYPMGISLYSVNSNQLGEFPFPSGMISTERFADGRTRQIFSRITGETHIRTGADNLWTGGGAGSWRLIPTQTMFEKLCDKLGVDFEELLGE